MDKRKVLLGILVVALISSFFIFDLGRFLSLEFLQEQRGALTDYQTLDPGATAAFYFAIYVLITALSLPAAAVVTLAGGALFGLAQGTLIVSFASTIGATLAFLLARTLFRRQVETRFSQTLSKINKGIEQDGAFYLFGLRLVPVFPFFAVNLLMGLTQMSVGRYFIVSQIGMLPGTLVYVNAGTQLAQINSLADIVSPSLLLSFALLGIFPIIAKKLLSVFQGVKVYKNYDKPTQFNTNMVVIGAGSGGLVSAYIAAAVKAKVTLIEKHKMGGDCLNTGCVPSKALIRSAQIAHYLKNASQYGLEVPDYQVAFPEVMSRVHRTIKTIEPHDSVERYTELGVDCVQGKAQILDPYRVQVNDQVITTQNIVIASGARPALPNIEGIDLCPVYTSDTIWEIDSHPKRLLVLGGGPIGCELAQSFHRLGSEVLLIGRSGQLLPKEDQEVGDYLLQHLEAEGLNISLNAHTQRITESGEGLFTMHYEVDGHMHTFEFDALLSATGRTPNTSGFGLEELGLELNDNGTIKVNEYLQTKFPNIYACGDVAGPYQLTHAASHQAWYVAVNALFGAFKKFKVDYRVIPWSTFTDPEVARVGLSEREATEGNIPFEVTRYELDDLDRAIADGRDYGFIKVLTRPGSDKILGACIVGSHAGDLIAEFTLAMKHGLGLNKILGTTHAYPTMMEGNKFLAGNWKKANAPEWIMQRLVKFHQWRRS